MANLIVALVVTVIILGGPFTLFAAIKILNKVLAAPKVRFQKLRTTNGPALGLVVSWDEESLPQQIYRVRVDAQEMVRGGRSTSFSFTFADRSAKKRSFVIPMQLANEDVEILTDGGSNSRALARSYITVEVETVDNQTVRVKLPKEKIRAAFAQPEWTPDNSVELLQPTAPDAWSLLTRIFPWKKAAAVAEAPAEKAKSAPKAAAANAAPQVADFVVTKVWIEPGCIVCDACENEAPEVFQVLADTCIVRENAPLTNALSIQSAADGCPVNVIKYTSVPKSA
jgi:ferredoxin